MGDIKIEYASLQVIVLSVGEGSKEIPNETVAEDSTQEENEEQHPGKTYMEGMEQKIEQDIRQQPPMHGRNKGMTLKFVVPTIKKGIPTACLDREEIEKEDRKWKSTIILYVIGESPTITYLTNFLEKQCQIENKPVIYYHNEDYFVIRYETMEERDQVLCG